MTPKELKERREKKAAFKAQILQQRKLDANRKKEKKQYTTTKSLMSNEELSDTLINCDLYD